MDQLHITNQVPAGRTWLESIKIELADLNPLSNWSIWRVPNNLLAVNKDAYSPHIISIGPLHHGEQNVLAMEVHKLHYMLSLLARTPDPAKSLDECGKAILRFDKHIRACYAEPIDKYKGKDLAKMLLVDGCFCSKLSTFVNCQHFLNHPIHYQPPSPLQPLYLCFPFLCKHIED
jgi:hypothetical protein